MKRAVVCVIICLLPFLVFSENKEYERFVGLGNCCITRSQIDLHLANRFNQPPYAFGGGQLFDWMLIHDYSLLCLAIERNLSDLLLMEDLAVEPTWHTPSVRNTKYQMTWNHLFTKDKNFILPDNVIQLEYKEKKQKIDYLIRKFIALKSFRTLYIVAYLCILNDPAYLTVEPDERVLKRLSEALENIRGNSNFSILYCTANKKFEDFDNIYVREIIDAPNSSEASITWNNILMEFPFKVTKVTSIDVQDKSAFAN